jgi:thioredoxin 1
MSKNIIEINETGFDSEVKNEQGVAVLVDFWASWCGPCAMVAPVLEKIADKNTGRLKICKVNVDSNHKLASEFGIMSIPTMILFKNGKEQERIVGALGEAELTRRLAKHIA